MKRDSFYEKQIEQARAWIKEAEVILIGAGAGVSTAAGLTYSGERFTDHFAEFIGGGKEKCHPFPHEYQNARRTV